MDLKNISTAELVRELSNREGVEKIARSFLWVPQEARSLWTSTIFLISVPSCFCKSGTDKWRVPRSRSAAY